MFKPTKSSLDSLQLRIDTTFIKFTDEGERILLNEYYLTNSSTGEIDEDTLKKYAYAHKELGITSRFLVRKAGHNQKEDKPTSEDLEMILNSKMLKHQYIHGMSKDNMKKVYEYIIGLGLFTVKYEDFLNHSRCTDIDIKTDLEGFTTDKTVQFFTGLNVIAPSRELYINPEKNLGIAYGFRSNERQINNNPYIKMYHKMVELKNNSREFYKEYLRPIYGNSFSEGNALNEICRIEGQIKNKNHFNSLLHLIGEPERQNTLAELLSLSEAQIKEIISILLNKQVKISGKVTTMEILKGKETTLSIKDKAIISAIKLEILEDGTIDTFIHGMTEGLARNSKYQYKNKFMDLYKTYLMNDHEVTQKTEFKSTLEQLLNMGKLA